MPKDTFFGLDKAKQQRLIDAAMKEFSKVPLNEASIAKIIKEAEIPRGSFYQYFENKEDLYFYCFTRLRDNSKRDLEDVMIEHQGDLFAGVSAYFNKLTTDVFSGKNAAFFKNLFLYTDYRSSKRFLPGETNATQKHRKHKKVLSELIDTSQLKVKDEAELQELLRLVMTIVFQTVGDAYAREAKYQEKINEEKVRALFALKLNWLQQGVVKPKK